LRAANAEEIKVQECLTPHLRGCELPAPSLRAVMHL
jgi:hypothetical protein